MKKCKACKSEIDKKATKCPKCGADQRIWFARHPILTVILAIVVIAIIGGSKGGSKSSNKTSSSPTPAPVAEKVSARDLADDFDDNQVSAEAKWDGKFVEFSAKITNITDSGLSFASVASDDFSLAQISCHIKDKEQLMNLKNGQTVTVRGIVGKQTIGVIDFDDCEVVE